MSILIPMHLRMRSKFFPAKKAGRQTPPAFTALISACACIVTRRQCRAGEKRALLLRRAIVYPFSRALSSDREILTQKRAFLPPRGRMSPLGRSGPEALRVQGGTGGRAATLDNPALRVAARPPLPCLAPASKPAPLSPVSSAPRARPLRRKDLGADLRRKARPQGLEHHGLALAMAEQEHAQPQALASMRSLCFISPVTNTCAPRRAASAKNSPPAPQGAGDAVDRAVPLAVEHGLRVDRCARQVGQLARGPHPRRADAQVVLALFHAQAERLGQAGRSRRRARGPGSCARPRAKRPAAPGASAARPRTRPRAGALSHGTAAGDARGSGSARAPRRSPRPRASRPRTAARP